MRIPLTQGAYTARSIIANAQRAVNVYPEKNPADSVSPFTHYNCPGLTPLSAALSAPARGLYWANNDSLYYVAGPTLYNVSAAWVLTPLGSLTTPTGIVSMADNGTSLVLVDGSSNGYEVNLTTNAFTAISEMNNSPSPPQVYAFYGANRVDMLDGFMVFNQPGTRNFYCTYNNEIVFDSTYFAAKNGYSDNLVSILVTRREIWLIGERTAELWFDAGGSTFPFQIMPGPFVQHGCSAVASVAQVNGALFWLSQDQAGQNIIVRGEGYQVKEISTRAIEAELATYPTTADAQGFCFQQDGHTFYQLNFPTADTSWRWDESTELWHQPLWTDPNGQEHRHRAACAAFAYGVNVCADWQTGQLYKLDPSNYTDNGAPMYFRRGFPHLMKDGRRVIYAGFGLDIQAATSPNTMTQPGPFSLLSGGGNITTGLGGAIFSGPAPIDNAPRVNLRWSDDRGATYSQPVPQSLGATGRYLTYPKWNRLGMARDRVFEVYGVIPGKLAINGAFLDPEPIVLTS